MWLRKMILIRMQGVEMKFEKNIVFGLRGKHNIKMIHQRLPLKIFRAAKYQGIWLAGQQWIKGNDEPCFIGGYL